MNIFVKILSRFKPSIRIGSDGTPVFSIDFQESLTAVKVDERIANLSKVHHDLLEAAQATEQLHQEAIATKEDLSTLRDRVERLNKDKKTSETVLSLDQESLARLLADANKLLKGRSVLVGILIGLITGFLSSWAVWYLTSQ
ncbi:hypothetical protein KAU32_02710 [bacterium]|nr:hypothetical protein [bacterium]